MVAAAQEERDLDPLALALGMREELAHRRAQAEVVRMRRAEVVERAGRAPRRARRSRIAQATSFTCDDDAGRVEHDEAVLDRSR